MRENLTQMPTGGLGSFLASNMDQIDDNVLSFGRGSGINSMSKIANRMANMGRNGDNELVHVKTGELIVSPEVLEKNPRLAKELTQSFQNMDENIGDYVVGSEGNSINPMTGQREFFLKGLVKGIKNLFKTVAPTLLVNFLFPGMGTIMKGVIGGGIGGLLQGKGIKGALQGATMGGLTAGLFKGFTGEGTFGQNIKADLGKGFSLGAPRTGGEMVQKIQDTGKSFLQKADAGVKQFFPKGIFPKQPDVSSPEFLDLVKKFETARASNPFELAMQASKPGMMDYVPAVGLATLGAGALGAFDTPEQRMPENPFGKSSRELLEANPELYRSLMEPYMAPIQIARSDVEVPTPPDFMFSSFLPQTAAKGGEMFPRKTGFIAGPGTETSDDVPAMLSDGEFVMTARAVRGLGNGSRKQGVRKMYDMMKNFEGSVPA
jgi:hypothetical protein